MDAINALTVYMIMLFIITVLAEEGRVLANTLPQGMDSSPVQRIMNRATRSLLPTRNDTLVTRYTTI